MKTISRPIAHKRLTTQHETMRWVSGIGSVSVRKTRGEYVVRLEDFQYGKVIKQNYKTLAGALVAAESLREFYL